MQIQNSNNVAAHDLSPLESRRSESSSTSAASAHSTATTTSLSAQSLLIHGSSASASDVRMDKVQSVRSALVNGNYHVDAGAVADKLISSLMAR